MFEGHANFHSLYEQMEDLKPKALTEYKKTKQNLNIDYFNANETEIKFDMETYDNFCDSEVEKLKNKTEINKSSLEKKNIK